MIRAFTLAALTFGGCATTGPAEPATVPPGPSQTAGPARVLGSPMRLAIGETADVDGLPVRFAEVSEDSRCPQNTTCVWEGRATVRLVVGETAAVLTVPHGGLERPDEPQSVVVNGSRLRVLALYPYPGSAEAEKGATVEVEVIAEALPE